MNLAAAFLAVAFSAVSAPGEPSSCAEVESPATAGRPHIIIPAGAIPSTGPLEVVYRLRNGRSMRRIGFGRPRAITCVQFIPGADDCSATKPQSCGKWIAHVEATFWFRPPLASGACRSTHGLAFIPDSDFGGHGARLLGSDCSTLGPSKLQKGR